MTECESTRGKWGGVCPDCGATLPNPKPIRSWMAERHAGSEKHATMAVATREQNPDHYYYKHRSHGLYKKTERRAAA